MKSSEKKGGKMKEITIKLPIRLIKEILNHIPREEVERLQGLSFKRDVKSVSADYLLKLDGIASIGGNAVEDTETIWE